EKLLSFVEVKPNQSYLDVGCGNGAAPTHIARKYGLNVTGIDVDPQQVQYAEENSKDLSNIRFLTIDGTQLPFEDNQFDIVSTAKTTHHIPNWGDALAEMIRVLKPDDYLIYSDLVYPAWIASIGKLVARSYGGYPTIDTLDSFVRKIIFARFICRNR
ncbi:MAG: class I SAM-dependent methyltransferase, partial [Bacteroidota bacterium]